jgi:hypothetical protein
MNTPSHSPGTMLVCIKMGPMVWFGAHCKVIREGDVLLVIGRDDFTAHDGLSYLVCLLRGQVCHLRQGWCEDAHETGFYFEEVKW